MTTASRAHQPDTRRHGENRGITHDLARHSLGGQDRSVDLCLAIPSRRAKSVCRWAVACQYRDRQHIQIDSAINLADGCEQVQERPNPGVEIDLFGAGAADDVLDDKMGWGAQVRSRLRFHAFAQRNVQIRVALPLGVAHTDYGDCERQGQRIARFGDLVRAPWKETALGFHVCRIHVEIRVSQLQPIGQPQQDTQRRQESVCGIDFSGFAIWRRFLRPQAAGCRTPPPGHSRDSN